MFGEPLKFYLFFEHDKLYFRKTVGICELVSVRIRNVGS